MAENTPKWCNAFLVMGNPGIQPIALIMTPSITKCITQNSKSNLFVYFCPPLDFSHDHSHNAVFEGGGQGEKLLVGGDIVIP